MKNTTNVFLEGLRMDLHPLSTSQLLLTDALNATMITYNGNEIMLQNDMGNTLILDSATGNIMGLSPGFVPIGMKEHGGIMYITSVDKEGNGEIGTIPSPIIRDFYKDKVIFEVNQSIPINVGDALKISNKLYPADKFIANLQMEINEADLIGQKFKKDSGLSPSPKDESPADESPTDDPSDIVLGRDVIRYTAGLAEKQTLYTPVLSYNSNISEIQLQEYEDPISLFSSKGIYSLELYSRHDNSSDIPASFLSSPLTYQYNNKFVESNYWYLHTEFPTSVFPKDLLTATLNQDLKQFPSNGKPGYLAVKLLTEGINKFDILPRAKDPFFTPITYKSYQSSSKPQYYTYFPGFYYSTNSGIYIDRIEARVIDESTANEMPLVYPYDANSIPQFTIDTLENGSLVQGWKNSYLYPPKKLVDLFANTWYSDPDESVGHMYNPYKISNTLPQVQSISDDNSFILTTLKQINDHSQTDMESSTEGENKTYGGVFCVPLGEKYNNWYRAEIDYYDLYNNKQGTFTKRFNPYLNDVFGTNLSVDNYSYGPQLKMGNKYNSGFIKKSLSDTIKLTYKSDNMYIGTTEDTDVTPTGELSKLYDTFSPITYVHNNGFTDLVTSLLLINNPNKVVLQFDDAYLHDLTDPTIGYLYDKNTTNECLNTILNNVSIDQSSKFRFLHPTDVGGEHIWILFDDFVLGLYDRYVKTCGALNFTTDYLAFVERRTDNRYYMHHQVWDYPVQFCSEESRDTFTDFPKFGDPITCDYMDMGYLEDKVLDASVGLKITINPTTYKQQICPTFYNREDSVWYEKPTRYEARILYIKDSLKERYTQLAEVITTFTASIDLPGFSISPRYSIVPYFCLTGANEEGKKVNVQRFGREEGTDIVYLHNFELEDSGKIKNYFDNDFSKSEQSKVVQCSYNHETPFYYYDEKLAYSNSLAPGIYILNITRIPGKATESDQLNHDVSLSIKIGDEGKTFNDVQWTATPDYYNMYNPLDEIDNLIYRPIVLIIKKQTNVCIETNANFYRQNIGLFKISGVNDSQSIIKLLNTIHGLSNIMFYDDYMYELEYQSVNFERIEKYNFIQKYGVFFKEAYVFIDGLIDHQGRTSGVTVRGKNYGSYPYIPSDPSVLPVHLSTEGEYIWNAYVMPESVLNVTDDKYPNFIFSNPLDLQSFSTKPDSGNLRQLVEQLN